VVVVRALLERLRGSPQVDGERLLLIRDAKLASSLTRPRQDGAQPVSPCPRCQRQLEPRVITTGGPTSDPELWDSVPIAVDGWVCGCNVLYYPRPMTPETSVKYGERGHAAVLRGAWREAEWWFTRIAWAWPYYAAAHVDLAAALERRLDANQETAESRRLIKRRIQQAYDAALEGIEKDPEATPVGLRAAVYLGVAKVAVHARASERAYRALDELARLDGLDQSLVTQAQDVARVLDVEQWIYREAFEVLSSHLHYHGQRTAVPIDTAPLRSRCVRAVETLEAHYAAHPEFWPSILASAMGRAALGDEGAALDLWRQAWRSHPEREEIALEAALALLHAEFVDEACTMNREATQRMPASAALWSNRAITELLVGQLDEARRCIGESRRLDPSNSMSKEIESRLAKYSTRDRLPQSLAELEGRRRPSSPRLR
jgi:tetratricopeptide (TPR) repeat protein